MIVYHSSAVVVDNPDIFHSRRYLDFGKGFYLTTIYEQAVRYAERFLRRGRTAWVNYYSLSFSFEDWKIKSFHSYDSE